MCLCTVCGVQRGNHLIRWCCFVASNNEAVLTKGKINQEKPAALTAVLTLNGLYNGLSQLLVYMTDDTHTHWPRMCQGRRLDLKRWRGHTHTWIVSQ